MYVCELGAQRLEGSASSPSAGVTGIGELHGSPGPCAALRSSKCYPTRVKKTDANVVSYNIYKLISDS